MEVTGGLQAIYEMYYIKILLFICLVNGLALYWLYTLPKVYIMKLENPYIFNPTWENDHNTIKPAPNRWSRKYLFI
jgi:hypothetical protein